MRTLAQFIGVLLLVGFVGAYFWPIVLTLATAYLSYRVRTARAGRPGPGTAHAVPCTPAPHYPTPRTHTPPRAPPPRGGAPLLPKCRKRTQGGRTPRGWQTTPQRCGVSTRKRVVD